VSESECREKPTKSVKVGVLWTELQELKAEIAEIKSSRTNNSASSSGSERSTRQNRSVNVSRKRQDVPTAGYVVVTNTLRREVSSGERTTCREKAGGRYQGDSSDSRNPTIPNNQRQ
jgi:hypothetical protein